MRILPLLTAALIAAVPAPALADTFTLKDGSVVEGSVLSETAEAYVLQVQITKTIKDDRTLLKADVTKVVREKLDFTAFEALLKRLPAPDFSTVSDYKERIAAFEKFIKTYPASAKFSEAKKIIAALQAEETQVAAGAIKVNAFILPKAEYLANAYEFDARALAAKIRVSLMRNDIRGALLGFSEMGREFPNTSAYTALLPSMTKLIRDYITDAQELATTLEARVKERTTGLERMPMAERKNTEAAIQEEDTAAERRYLTEKAALIRWPTLAPFHADSLADTIAFGQVEMARLSALPATPSRDGGKLYREAVSASAGGADAPARTAALAAAKAAGVPDRYLAPLAASATAAP